MHRLILAAGLAAASVLPGCMPGGADSHLDCAALISAASQLSVQGQLDTGEAFGREALVSSMTHLNAYAIPNGVGEVEAFEQVNARRAELVETQTPEGILDRASACIRKTPGQ